MSWYKLAVVTTALGLTMWLQGCGGGGGGPTPAPTPPAPTGAPTPSPPTTTSTSTTTCADCADNIWQFRPDLDYAVQTTFDMSGDYNKKSLYGGCYQNQHKLPLEDLAGGNNVINLPGDEQCKENDVEFCKFVGTTGMTLYDRQNDRTKRGCLMRKSRLPIDFSKIGRMELDVTTSSSNGKAPWYAVWLVPMVYPDQAAAEDAAEIDLLENHKNPESEQGILINEVHTQFSTCGLDYGQYKYTLPYCKNYAWGAVANKLNTHITLKATKEEGRTLEVWKCPVESETCDPHKGQATNIAHIKVLKTPPHGHPDWFPIWQESIAGEHYGHYWLVTDIFYTSGSDFQGTVKNIKFFYDNGTEWVMPLDGPPPRAVNSKKLAARANNSTQFQANGIII